MLAVRTLFSCFGLFILAFFLTTFFWGAAGYYATRTIASGVESQSEDEVEEERERDERVLEWARDEERRREGIRVDSGSGRPMQRPQPMVDVSNRR